MTFYPVNLVGGVFAAPVTIAQGGTGQVTASASRTALGVAYDGTAADILPVVIAASAGANGLVADSGHVHPVGYAEAGFTTLDQGFIAQAYDIGLSANATILATTVVNLIRINLRQNASITSVSVAVSVAGSGLTSGQSFLGLYNSAGTLVGTSTTQDIVFASTGVKTAALVSGPFAVSAGFCWVAVFSVGTTPPQLCRMASQPAPVVNAGYAAATARFATNGTATTALAGSITPSSNVLAGVSYWAAVS